MNVTADAVIVAAGSGSRAGLDMPKQFFELHGKPIVFYTIEVFCKCHFINRVVVVLPNENFEKHESYMRQFADFENVIYVRGGNTRMESVHNGLELLADIGGSSVICIHDGVRPFVTENIIRESIECAQKYGAALTAVKITDTVKSVENGIVKATCDRNKLYAAQTPQTFRFDVIMEAYRRAFKDKVEFTDDCAAAEYIGVDVHIVNGSRRNIKLTMHEDFEDLL